MTLPVEGAGVDPRAEAPRKGPRARRVLRPIGSLLIVAGLGVMAWSAVVVFWQDPFTALYAHRAQRSLEADYTTLVQSYRLPAVVRGHGGLLPVRARAAERRRLRAAARAYRLAALEGEPIGRLIVPRLGVNAIVVNGASIPDLRKGPGRDLRSSMPGEGKLVYIAGHRTTYGAPFRHINELEPGDRIELVMPYGRFHYRVTGHAIVFPSDTRPLRWRAGEERIALQASHPRYSARQRYVAYGRLVDARPTDSRT